MLEDEEDEFALSTKTLEVEKSHPAEFQEGVRMKGSSEHVFLTGSPLKLQDKQKFVQERIAFPDILGEERFQS